MEVWLSTGVQAQTIHTLTVVPFHRVRNLKVASRIRPSEGSERAELWVTAPDLVTLHCAAEPVSISRVFGRNALGRMELVRVEVLCTYLILSALMKALIR